MAFRSFSSRLLLFLAIFGVGLVILMSGIHVRPFGFADAFDAVRVYVGGAIMGAALILELVLESRASRAGDGGSSPSAPEKRPNGAIRTPSSISACFTITAGSYPVIMQRR